MAIKTAALRSSRAAPGKLERLSIVPLSLRRSRGLHDVRRAQVVPLIRVRIEHLDHSGRVAPSPLRREAELFGDLLDGGLATEPLGKLLQENVELPCVRIVLDFAVPRDPR